MIVAMKKATVAFMSDKLEKVTEELQRCGEFMPIVTDSSVSVKAVSTPILDEEADTALKAYSKYRKSPGMLSGPSVCSEQEFCREDPEEKTRVIKAVELYEKLGSVEVRIKQCDDERAELLPFEALGLDAKDQAGTRYTSTVIGRIPYSANSKNAQPLDVICADNEVDYTGFADLGGQKYFYLCVLKENEKELVHELEEHGFERLRLPYKEGTGKEALQKNEKKKQQLTFLYNSISDQLKEESEHAQSVEIFYDREKARADRAEIPADVTESTTVLTGWVRSDKTEEVEAAIAAATDVYGISFDDPAEDETPPSVTKDPYLIDQYSTITNSYSPPGRNDIDPNPFMAPWYFMLFGMIIGDVGYGVLIAIVMLIIKKVKKPTGDFAKIVNVMLYSCIPAVIWGILYGSYFGAEIFPPVLFSPIQKPPQAMIVAIAVGVLHIFTGLIIKAVMNIKAGKWLDALTDQFAWIALMTGVGLLILEQTRTAGIIVALSAVAVIIILGGHSKPTVFGKITGGFMSLTGVTNYLSDILSYLRVFALALASGLIGMVMNTVAQMVAGFIPVPVLNVIVTLPIYILGHGLNTALSILGAYVHTGRLQYIEFFSKFYEGNGVYFRPLSRKNKYTQISNKK
ncbi:MAG: V-type ATP synthase subunit I [Clostridia bacterium]|nr:V-type ATP synthase subunit I [Clostridia bacterium]